MATMANQRIILLRHAEKPSPDGRVGGVDTRGQPDADELSVRGWQRAGALARFFAPGGGDLGVPDALFAQGPTPEHPSRRCISTLQPLAERLGHPLDQRFQRSEEAELAEALSRVDGLALAAWDHRHLGKIARALLGDADPGPPEWPEDCFDRLWLFSREGAGWRFEERGQDLLAGDAR
jgi:broad specificity phosphatase PhoE